MSGFAHVKSKNNSAMSSTSAHPRLAFKKFISNVQYEHLVAGVTGGVVSTLLLHPFDLIKIRFAVDDGAKRARPHYRGVMDAFGTIFSAEGVRGLYRGVTPNVCGAGSSWGLYFFIYGSTKAYIQQRDSARDIGMLSHLLTACWAGVLTLTVTNPIWVVKTRLCLQYSSEVSHVPERLRYGGMVDAFRKTYQCEGVRGLYKGFVPGVWGVSHGALQFMCYEKMKSSFNRRRGAAIDAKLSAYEYMGLAAASKMVAAVVTYPYQVVRARLQDQTTDYKSSVDVLRRTLRSEGWRGFYKGLSPNLMRVVPATSITFVVYETLSEQLRAYRTLS